MKRLLGLDVGSKTVGVAVSDALGWTAQGLEIIPINENKKEFGIDRIDELVSEYNINAFVIGLPKNMNGSIGSRAEASLNYGDLLQNTFKLPVHYQDERLSSMQVNRMMVEEGNLSRKKRKQVVDKLAAVVILQSYLDRNSSN